MSITNIAGYKFLSLHDLDGLRTHLLARTTSLALKGTILLSTEGINLNLAGLAENIAAFQQFVAADSRFQDMTFRTSISKDIPFRFLKVKIRKEIITMRRPEVRAETARAASISPQQLKAWLDENKDVTILDTRNDYEVRFGTFKNAQHFELTDFNHFPAAAEKLDTSKPVVMFCTGGIRCEKAALHLQNTGCNEVYQLEGGILNYFAEVGGEHYEGECFVFDERISVNAQLEETGTLQCSSCNGPYQSQQQADANSLCIACSDKCA